MKPEQLQAIRERVNKATPGPWRFDIDDRDVWCRIDGGTFPIIMTIAKEPEDEDRCLDFDFIAHARKDVPALLEEIERLRGALEYYANPKHWEMKPDGYMGFTTYDDALVESDKGERARQALAGEFV